MKVILLAVMAFWLSSCGCEQVSEGERGVETDLGKATGILYEPGLHFYNPFTKDIKTFNVREARQEGKITSFTKDQQNVEITLVATYYPDTTKIIDIYKQYGQYDWATNMTLGRIVESAVKNTVSKYTAEELVARRAEAEQASKEAVKVGFAERWVILTGLSFANLDFSDTYEQAIEAKVTAIQKAAEAKNKTVEVEEKAKQTVIEARAEAESMKIRSEALRQNQGLVEFEAVKKWNGALPQYMMGNSVPFINLEKK